MSNMTHTFNLNLDATEHHLISSSPNLTITSKGAPGEENVFMASKWGEYNHVEGFETGKDKIKIPLDVIKEVYPTTAIVKGTLPAERYEAVGGGYDTLLVASGGVLTYIAPDPERTGSAGATIKLLTLDGTPAPTVVAADIEIV